MNKTIFIAAMLAVATVLAAGLTVLPASVQEAQANPCANEIEIDVQIEDSTSGSSSSNPNLADGGDDERKCEFIGNEFEFDED